MPLAWNLKKWLAVEHDIYRASELQALLSEKAGVQLSIQSIGALLNGRPHALRIQTIQAICNALNCKLSDFCDVLPEIVADSSKKRANSAPLRLYGPKVLDRATESIFPDPRRFEKQNKRS